ncbi:molecular chaperone [Providencia rettgeri]|uniref:fimbrial biogenesis chaperone n=3 Tax=Morganellaceae TaxID=1903414 RepID=UPI0018E460DF|nr:MULTISPECIES: molecular chaperone [Providencia]MBI6194744.1 molecular chaperone [Providencia rettgeri]MCX9097569.1 molecular chaperone [Providencia rettgeri]MCX9125480.1 molecular chaperone [Providencia rettgeri]MCX9130085.1 molecular chaperone [Providencia rettgeri]
MINFYKKKYFLYCLFLISYFSYSMNSGLLLEGTRVIYSENEKNGVTFNITNNTDKNFLLQSRILEWDKIKSSDEAKNNVLKKRNNDELPFIVVPPLSRFESEQKMTLHIQMIKDTLPKDRESIFSLSLKTIPSQEKSDKNNKLIIALQNNIKLFYRPSDLIEMDSNSKLNGIEFNINNKKLTVKNTTPYYLTLSKLSSNKINLLSNGNNMIAPFEEIDYLSDKELNNIIQWQILDDDGRMSKVAERIIN